MLFRHIFFWFWKGSFCIPGIFEFLFRIFSLGNFSWIFNLIYLFDLMSVFRSSDVRLFCWQPYILTSPCNRGHDIWLLIITLEKPPSKTDLFLQFISVKFCYEQFRQISNIWNISFMCLLFRLCFGNLLVLISRGKLGWRIYIIGLLQLPSILSSHMFSVFSYHAICSKQNSGEVSVIICSFSEPLALLYSSCPQMTLI